MASYSARLKRDIARWVETGLITPAIAAGLVLDVDANERRSLSFGTILAMMAALLVAAAILLIVASNWEAIPRLGRVASLFAVILAGYAGGAVLRLNDHPAFGEALYIVGAAAFGGSIALVGQMYHMSGDEASALVTWSIGTGLAAAVLRSGPLTIAAVGIAVAWLVLWFTDYLRGDAFPYSFLVLAGALWVVSYWTQSAGARHLVLLSAILYASMLVMKHDVIPVALPMAAVSAALFAAAVLLPAPVERVTQLDGRFVVHCLLGFCVAMVMLQVEVADETVRFGLAAIVTFAGIVAAVLSAGRQSRGLRWLAYAAFSLELAIVYVVMLGTMLGTAGLFFASGIVLALIAFLIIRVEKRLRPEPAAQGAAT